MSSTTTRSAIGGSDIEWYDGVTATFTRLTTTGGQLTLNKIGNEVDVAEAYGAGTTSYDALNTAIGTIGSNKRTLVLKPGTWSITSDLTIPANLTLKIAQGAILAVSTTKTLTINGPIEAGPYQIFSWAGTGAIVLSGSPTQDCHIEWWGATTGVSNDCAAAFTKAIASVGRNQTIRVNNGLYRIASTVTFTASTDYGFGLAGNSPLSSMIYIDVGASNHGLVFDTTSWWIKDIGFIGPTSACKSGVVIGASGKQAIANIENCNFFMGAADYALLFNGSTYSKVTGVDIGHYGTLYEAVATCVRPANGIGLLHPSPTDYGNTAVDIFAYISLASGGVAGGNGIYIENGVNVKIKGSIEGCTYPIYVDGKANAPSDTCFAQFVNVENLYAVDGNTNSVYFKDASQTTINNCLLQNGDNAATFTRCLDTSIINTRFNTLTINADCQKTVLDNVGVYVKFNDYADDTVCTSPVYSVYSNSFNYKTSNPPQAVNILANADFARFTTGAGTPPEGWSTDSGTWAANTTIVRQNGRCAEFNTNGGNRNPGRTFLTDELTKIKGQVASFSVNVLMDTAPATYGYLYIDVTVPTWAAGTVYNLGDCVIPTVPDGYKYKAIAVTGDQKSAAVTEPTWPTATGSVVVDNHVTWQRISAGGRSEQMDVSMVGTLGRWKTLTATTFIPRNATAAQAYISAYKASGGDVKYYMADACLTGGGWSPFYVPTTNTTANVLTLSNAGATTTAVDDVAVTAYSKIILQATSANAAAAVGTAAGVYISAKTAGQFTVTHPASPGASATMDYFVFN